MVTINKIYTFTTPDALPDQVIYILQDEDGWFWVKKLVEHEGFATPFTSLQEVELYLEVPLRLIEENERESDTFPDPGK